MKYKIIFLAVITMSIVACSSDDNRPPDFIKKAVEEPIEEPVEELVNNATLASIDNCAAYDAYVKSLLLNKWRTVPELVTMCNDDYKNTIVSEMENRTADTGVFIGGLSDQDIVWFSLMYRFLKDSEIRTEVDMKTMSFDDFRNTVIDANQNSTEISLSELQGNGNAKNLNIAYGWWLAQQNTGLFTSLNDVTGNPHFFDIKDSNQKNMDVLRIVDASELAYKYLGVYHVNKGDGVFELWLAGSNDLESWTAIIILGDRAHQGDIKKWGDGYIVVHEEDDGSTNNIRVKYYESYADLIENTPSRNVGLPRAFSNFAEGTPDIREIHGDASSSSAILIGFHQFNDGDTDQQSFGILKDFQSWFPWKDDISNYNLKDMGYNGNFGGRTSFNFNDKNHVLVEAQGAKNGWETWRLLLGDGAFYSQLNMDTPKGSTSFANPGIVDLGNGEFAVTSFLPTEGNQSGEIGTLLYKVQF